MNRRVELMGAPINVPDVLSGIQTFVENYFGQVIKTLASKGGIVRPMSDYQIHTPPCELYVSAGSLYIRPGQILFPVDPFPILHLEGEQIYTPVSELISHPTSNSFYVYAIYNREESGIFKKRASGFVYNDSLPGGYYDRLLDDIIFEVVPTEEAPPLSSQKILVATLYNSLSQLQAEELGYKYYGGLSINQLDGAQFTEHGIMAKFADRYLTLNTVIADLLDNDLTAGMKILAESNRTVNWLVVPSGLDYRWETDIPISAADPITDDEVVTMGWLKNYLIETFYEVPDTFNFRMTDISAISSYSPLETEKALFSTTGPKSVPRILRLYFKWGYDNIIGTASQGTDYFNITNIGITFSNGDLEGYYFWIPVLQSSYIIYDNVGNTIYLKNMDGTSFSFPSNISINQNEDQLTNAWIHMNATNYQLMAAPRISENTYGTPVTTVFTGSRNTPVYMQGYIDLPALKYYHIQLRGARVGEPSDWEVLSTGTFNKYFPISAYTVEDIPFTNPHLVKHPNIYLGNLGGGDPLLATLQSTNNGFSVTLHPELWLDAEEYELIYSLNSDDLDFTDRPGVHKIVFSGRTVALITNSSGLYYVKIRPLIAGMAVADSSDYFVGSVQAAAAGSEVGEVIAEFDIDFNSYKGTFTHNMGEYTWDITSISTPGIVSGVIGIHGNEITDRPIISQYPNLNGTVATVDGVDYTIEQIDGDSLLLTNTSTGALLTAPHGTSKSFTIGVSKRARRVHRSNQFIKDYRIVRVSISVDLVRHYPVNMRIYQDNFDLNGYDNLTISTGGGEFVVDMDVLIIGTQGNRNLIVDLFDPSTGANWTYKNAGGLVGHVKVYAIPVRTVYGINPVSQS